MNQEGTLILCYHRVAQGVDDPFGLCVRPDNFASHLDELLRVAEPSMMDDISRPSRKRRIVVTLDDGYADNLWNALPIARAKGVPLTVFVTSSKIDDVHGLWTGWRPYCSPALERSRSSLFLCPRARSRWRSGDRAQHQTWQWCAATCGHCRWRR